MAFSTTLTVNGVTRTIQLDDPRVTLLDLLRERLELTGTKKGCDRGQCGACTVIVNGRRIISFLALRSATTAPTCSRSRVWRRATGFILCKRPLLPTMACSAGSVR